MVGMMDEVKTTIYDMLVLEEIAAIPDTPSDAKKNKPESLP